MFMPQSLETLHKTVDLPVQLLTVILEINYSVGRLIERTLQSGNQRLLGPKPPRDGSELAELGMVRTADQ